MALKQLIKDEMHNLLSNTAPYLDDIPVSITYTQAVEPGDYNWTSGAVDEGSNVDVTVKGVLGPFSRQQITLFNVGPNDVQFKFSFKGVSFTPQIRDTLVHNGITYIVIDKNLNASESVWTLQLRS